MTPFIDNARNLLLTHTDKFVQIYIKSVFWIQILIGLLLDSRTRHCHSEGRLGKKKAIDDPQVNVRVTCKKIAKQTKQIDDNRLIQASATIADVKRNVRGSC